jgi:glucose-1-phosphate thymidylyltransferase
MIDEPIGLIPAAGKGVRLGLPYPKELYPVIRENRYKPVAQFVVDNLVTAGVKDVVIVINETKAQLIGYFGDGRRFGCHVAYAVQEPTAPENSSTSPGLADALDSGYHLTRGRLVFFGMADTIMTPGDVFFRTRMAMLPDDDVMLTLFETTRPEKFGMVRLTGDGRVEEIVDKPQGPTSLTHMWGAIVWRARFTEFLHDAVSRRHERDFALILNQAIAAGLQVRGTPFPDGTFSDLGTYDEIRQLDLTYRQP